MTVVVHSPEDVSWVRYDRPEAVFEAHAHDEVPGILAHPENEVERTGLPAYEAGRAFDAAMPAASGSLFPLLWFGLFRPPETLSCDAPASNPS